MLFIGLLILALSPKVKQVMPSLGHRKKRDIMYYGRWMMMGAPIAERLMWNLCHETMLKCNGVVSGIGIIVVRSKV